MCVYFLRRKEDCKDVYNLKVSECIKGKDINFSIFLLTRCRLCLLFAGMRKKGEIIGGADEGDQKYYSEIASYIKFNLYDQQPLLQNSYYLKYHMRVHFSFLRFMN